VDWRPRTLVSGAPAMVGSPDRGGSRVRAGELQELHAFGSNSDDC